MAQEIDVDDLEFNDTFQHQKDDKETMQVKITHPIVNKEKLICIHIYGKTTAIEDMVIKMRKYCRKESISTDNFYDGRDCKTYGSRCRICSSTTHWASECGGWKWYEFRMLSNPKERQLVGYLIEILRNKQYNVPMKALRGNASIAEIRAKIASNKMFETVKQTGKGRTKKTIIRDINDIITKFNEKQ